MKGAPFALVDIDRRDDKRKTDEQYERAREVKELISNISVGIISNVIQAPSSSSRALPMPDHAGLGHRECIPAAPFSFDETLSDF